MSETVCSPVCPQTLRRLGTLASWLLLFLALVAPLCGQDFAATWYVSPQPGLGKDEPGRGRTPAAPLRSIAYALRAAEAKATLEPEAHLRIALLAGEYTDEVDGTVQVFPLILPTNPALLQIDAADGPGRVVITPPHSGLNAFEYADGGDPTGKVTYRFKDLRLEGGFFGLYFQGVSREALTLEIEACEFLGQGARNVNVSSVEGAMVDVRVVRSRFTKSLGGLFLSAPPRGRMLFAVSESRFTHMQPYSPTGLLGGGVELNLEPASWLEGSIDRCYFSAAASAVQITEPEVHPDEGVDTTGYLQLDFTNNVVTGLPPGEGAQEERLKNAFYLSLRPHHATKLKVVNNTFADLVKYISYVDNWEFLAADQVGFVGFEFINNICHAIGAPGQSEFYEEVLALEYPFSGLVFPVSGTVIRSNLLEDSAAIDWPGLNNLKADPRFVNEARGDLQLTAGSPAVDRGDPMPFRAETLDFAGSCRRANPVCSFEVDPLLDIGAFELPGVCETGVNGNNFVRGDCNRDNAVDLADAIYGFSFLFMGARGPSCMDRCDVNDDGEVDLSDGIYTLIFLYNGGVPPVAPFPQAGPDPNRDCLPYCK